MERVWIGLGSNMLNPKKQIDEALWSLSILPMTKLVVFSSYYSSRPLGQKNQADFLNAIAVLDTTLSPKELLHHIQYIERKQGRIQHPHNFLKWQSRTLDLDILLFGKYVINTSELVIPHYDMFNREFVIYPLIELDNRMIFPDGKVITDIVRTLPKNGLDLWKNNNF